MDSATSKVIPFVTMVSICSKSFFTKLPSTSLPTSCSRAAVKTSSASRIFNAFTNISAATDTAMECRHSSSLRKSYPGTDLFIKGLIQMVVTTCSNRFHPNSTIACLTELILVGIPKYEELVSFRILAVSPGSYFRILSTSAAVESELSSSGSNLAAVAGMPGNASTSSIMRYRFRFVTNSTSTRVNYDQSIHVHRSISAG